MNKFNAVEYLPGKLLPSRHVASKLYKSNFSFIRNVYAMPAASSFADGEYMTLVINLELVNEHLQWNPYPADREAVQDALWNKPSESPSQPQPKARLESATNCARFYARRLAEYHDGRVLLEDERPGQRAMDPQYWYARAAFYKIEADRLEEEDYNRSSRSVTPGFIHPDLFGATELEKAKGHAENAAFRLASISAGRKFLDAEKHGATDAEFWRSKEKVYNILYDIFPKESGLDRAQRHANINAKKLATFAEGEALLKVEDHGASASDPQYWERKEEYYQAQCDRLQQAFWDDWVNIHFGCGSPLAEESSPSESATNLSLPNACYATGKERNITRSGPASRLIANTAGVDACVAT